MADITIAPIDPSIPFGAAVSGLRLDDLQDEAVTTRLRKEWIATGLIVFREVEGRELQLALSRVFGSLMTHPTRETIADHKELMTVRYRPDSGWLISVNGEPRGTWLPWHSDLIYVDKINRGGILRPIRLPSHLGETGFIDKIAAYRTLPDDLKRQIANLDVIYKYDLDPSRQKFGRTAEAHMIRVSPDVLSIQNRLDDFPRVIHPMVYEQAETGRKVLNVSPWFAVGIAGMENDQGDALLARVADHIVNAADRYIHHWQPNDMVLWDNWRMLHSASGSPVDEERWLERTTIAGDYGLGRAEKDAAIDGRDYISV